MRVLSRRHIGIWVMGCIIGTMQPGLPADQAIAVATIGEAKLLPDGTHVALQSKQIVSAESDFQATPSFLAGVNVGAVQPAALSECSGLVASRKNPGVFWAHNDSGDSARVFAITKTGVLLGTYTLTGASAVDYEDISIGPGPSPGVDYLYVGDIGDNLARRGSLLPGIVVYRAVEPAVSVNQSPVSVALTDITPIKLHYEDGARDAETLMIDPGSADIYIVSKRDTPSRVYRTTAAEIVPNANNTLHRLNNLTFTFATGGDISPQGTGIVVRNPSNIYYFMRPPGTALEDAFLLAPFNVALASEPQGEAVCFAADGDAYYSTSEGANQPIWQYSRRGSANLGFSYICETGRAAGIRVSTANGQAQSVTRQSRVDVDGTLATTSQGERQITNVVVTESATGDELLPLGTTISRIGGSDFGTLPTGQAGLGTAGLNNIGLLMAIQGAVTGIDGARRKMTVQDASGLMWVDTTCIRSIPAIGTLVKCSGLVTLDVDGQTRVPCLIPRNTLDIVPL